MNKIAFDVDGTLIDMEQHPNYDVINLLLWFYEHKWKVYIWSGGGVEYALHHTFKLGLNNKAEVIEKGSKKVDIAVDDVETTQLGDVLINVKGNYNL